MNIHLYIYLCVHLSIHVYICLYICTSVYVYVRLSKHMHVCLYICTSVCEICTSVCTYVHLSIHMYICLNICTSVYTMYVSLNMYVCLYICTSVYTYVHLSMKYVHLFICFLACVIHFLQISLTVTRSAVRTWASREDWGRWVSYLRRNTLYTSQYQMLRTSFALHEPFSQNNPASCMLIRSDVCLGEYAYDIFSYEDHLEEWVY